MSTLKDIAERAGVSVGTVDRIMHKRGRFSEETARKVRRIARELDYRPNLVARQLSTAAEYRIALLMPEASQDSSYWSLPLAGAMHAAEELAPFGLQMEVFHFNRYSASSFRTAARELLKQKWDGVLMAPLRDRESLELLDALGGDVPVVFFDTDLPAARSAGFIGQDSKVGGRLAARLLGLAARARSCELGAPASTFVIVAPDAQNDHLDHRIRGFRENIGSPVDLCVVNVESDHDTEAYRRALDRSIGPDTAGIFVIDASSHFVAEYLSVRFGTEKDDIRRPPIVGFDLVPANRKWMVDGLITFLLTQRPVEQGGLGIRRLFRKVFQNEDIPGKEYVPIDIVTPDNLAYLTPGDHQ